MRGAAARKLAWDADLFVVKTDEYGALRVQGGVLEVGPGADEDAIATVACRRMLSSDGDIDESSVQRFVESLGYAYVPQREQLIDKNASGVAYRAVS